MMVSKGWAVYSPVTKRIELSTFYTNPARCREWAVKYGTVHGGAAMGETWSAVKAKGYRVVRVTVTMRETKS